MTHFMRSGNTFQVAPAAAIDMHDKLPVGTYTVKFDEFHNKYFLEVIEDLSISGKLYGDTARHAERILTTFAKRDGSTGVMLSGEKGSGKTLLAKLLSIVARKQDGIPTIVINQPYFGETFNTFMQMIDQPLVVIFDEFEKVYDLDAQDKMLTLLDGIYPSKKLFVITCNDKYRVNGHIQNRPGRVFYHLNYVGLDNEFIIQYCEDNLNDRSQTQAVTRAAMMFSAFNFDMLKAMVEEMNRYDESPQDVMKLINAKPESGDVRTYDVKLVVDGHLIDPKRLEEKQWRGNPLDGNRRISISYGIGEPDEVGYYPNDVLISVSSAQLYKVDPETGEYKYRDAEGNEVILTRQMVTTYNMEAF